jgi:Putative zincin peptidase
MSSAWRCAIVQAWRIRRGVQWNLLALTRGQHLTLCSSGRLTAPLSSNVRLYNHNISMPISFTLGKPPSNPIVASEPGWSRLPGYDDSMPSTLRAIGVGLLFAATLAIAWHALAPQGLTFETRPAVSSAVIVFLIATVGHEMCHLLLFPRLGLQNAVIGVWPQMGALFVQYLQPVTRLRFIVAALAPTIFICLVPLVAGINGAAIPAFLPWAAVVTGVAVGADLLAVVQLLRHSSKTALVLESNHALFQREA